MMRKGMKKGCLGLFLVGLVLLGVFLAIILGGTRWKTEAIQGDLNLFLNEPSALVENITANAVYLDPSYEASDQENQQIVERFQALSQVIEDNLNEGSTEVEFRTQHVSINSSPVGKMSEFTGKIIGKDPDGEFSIAYIKDPVTKEQLIVRLAIDFPNTTMERVSEE